MEKFILNHSIPGYERVEIEDERLSSKNSTVIMILDESTSTLLHKYYNKVIEMCIAGTNLICISVGQASKIRKAIMMAMVTYRNYNIYKVSSIDIIDQDYIVSIESREPDVYEVQQFIGGDVAAYQELTTLIFGISNLAKSGDMDGLKAFIERHYESIEGSIEIIEYLKKLADSTNSGDLIAIIDTLKGKVEIQAREVEELNEELKQYKEDNAKLSDRVSTLTNDVKRANRKVADLEEQVSNASDGPVINSYRKVDTTLIKCKTRHIIYFKEISYAKYTNSMVVNLFNILKNTYSDSAIKMLIYDNKVGIPGLYKGISIVNTNDYLSNKASIIRDTPKFVVTEPNQVILEDILTSINPQFDIVIIYDRMRQSGDLVSGNNVTKIFVINSFSTYNSVKDTIRFIPGTLIISNDTKIPGSVRIGNIAEYSTASESAKMARYSKLAISENNSGALINFIINKARIDSMNGGA